MTRTPWAHWSWHIHWSVSRPSINWPFSSRPAYRNRCVANCRPSSMSSKRWMCWTRKMHPTWPCSSDQSSASPLRNCTAGAWLNSRNACSWMLTHWYDCTFNIVRCPVIQFLIKFLFLCLQVLQNCDELFDREELSAAPDVGWPDCFNSGVFVFKPSQDTFTKLTQFAAEKGSFDGGDQGLLNLYFSDWATQDSSRRLPFVYNTCSTACYSYLPAFKQWGFPQHTQCNWNNIEVGINDVFACLRFRFGENVKILHFIGKLKPWLITFDPCSKRANPPAEQGHLSEYLAHWWNVFCDDVHPKLSTDMVSHLKSICFLHCFAPYFLRIILAKSSAKINRSGNVLRLLPKHNLNKKKQTNWHCKYQSNNFCFYNFSTTSSY